MKPENNFKKTFAAALLTIASAPLLMSLLFIAKQQRIHFVMDNYQKEENFSITIPAADIHWIRKGKELLANGRMLDVKSICIKNGMASITGHYDETEESLVDGFSKIITKKKSPFSTGNSNIKFIFLPLFYLTGLIDDAKNSTLVITARRPFSPEEIIALPLETESPPPRIIA